MFGKSSGRDYQILPQKDPGSAPGLYSSVSLGPFSSGRSFDYVPRIKDPDFTDKSQGLLSWICNLIVIFLVFLGTLITFPISAWFVLKTVPNFERIVVFRLGRIRPPKGPGVVLVLPLIDQWQRVDLRTRAFNIPPCKVTTQDGGLVSVGADIQFRIWNPVMSVVAVQDLNASTRLTAQNVMTQSLSKRTVREIQTDRVKLGEHLGMDINDLTKLWGLEVDRVELTLEGVLHAPDQLCSGPLIMPPSVPGLEGLAGPLQQLAMHFMGQGRGQLQAAPQPAKDTVSFTSELSMEVPAVESSYRVEESSRRVEDLLTAVRPVLSDSLVRKVGACFQFYISTSTGNSNSYYVDLTKDGGSCGVGEVANPDVSLSMSEEDLLSLFQGSLQPFAAYTGGRLRVQGDLATAMKLHSLISLLRPL
ncbi:stomatin-like protein 1 [Brachyhypopomus gauderio]|uniref:stomatin-like protein 1 n=1 Tax=Brachyhypopomus gauderio TaxID=698409 RepID=UPI0040412FFC